MIAILCIVFYLIFLFGKWKEKFKNQANQLSNIGKISNKVDILETTLKTQLPDIKKISDKVIALETKVDLIYQNTNPNKIVKSYILIIL